jgi:DNA adenine methylase
MKYMGSKRRIAKYILPIILKDRTEDSWYVEPFVGGANIIDKVQGKRIGNDINKYLIALLQEMQKDTFTLPFIGEKEYKEIQNNKNKYEDWLVGYTGFNLSFGAKWFGGYRRDKTGIRNYENEAQQNLKAQRLLIKNIIFTCGSYITMSIPDNYIIYCDPPYANTTKYKDKFNHDEFWDWCRIKSKNNKVYISEYTAPEDFKCIWSKEIVSSLTKDTGSKTGVEKLFIYNFT